MDNKKYKGVTQRCSNRIPAVCAKTKGLQYNVVRNSKLETKNHKGLRISKEWTGN